MLVRSFIIFYIVAIGTRTVLSKCSGTKWLIPGTCTGKTLPKGEAFNVFSRDQKLKCFKACTSSTTGNCLSVSYDRRNQLCHQFDDISDNCTDMVEEPDTQYYYKVRI
ncbi:hypothetical protein SNE40_008479 [Patella caerulea]|uniref:Apple domain-containing protein n=1 Tax=Patella caerulea TaxID=87958 RepID=A0AAN8JZT2_PATCE